MRRTKRTRAHKALCPMGGYHNMTEKRLMYSYTARYCLRCSYAVYQTLADGTIRHYPADVPAPFHPWWVTTVRKPSKRRRGHGRG